MVVRMVTMVAMVVTVMVTTMTMVTINGENGDNGCDNDDSGDNGDNDDNGNNDNPTKVSKVTIRLPRTQSLHLNGGPSWLGLSLTGGEMLITYVHVDCPVMLTNIIQGCGQFFFGSS